MCQEEGCFMGTMRLPVGHQTVTGLVTLNLPHVILKRLVKLCCCACHTIYIYPEKSAKFGLHFPLSICVSGITLYLEYEQYLGFFKSAVCLAWQSIWSKYLPIWRESGFRNDGIGSCGVLCLVYLFLFTDEAKVLQTPGFSGLQRQA